ncbi:uncharacterized protein KY384_007170 [Bacidia gigantensis]|uniref:uncharacterized protein n=1 Tax=Bacidia gigantensis TaxID=2732470 RepID=UPI001D05265C|nr:uncharacterized protein KY384_007170 [Bacidia gigantensis]KAG8528253.1 hypothetical protein KY384_007170 [Bacidia gigantensis]
MSENIPESVPTSQDPRSKRPLKRRALSPLSKQASEVEALFANPEREVNIPSTVSHDHRSKLPAPPEIVANVQGSSAGAGSGEFHVYKASRRREYERLKQMDEETAKEQADADFESKREEQHKKDDQRTEKNRKKREKQRQRKGGKDKRQEKNDEAASRDRNALADTAEEAGGAQRPASVMPNGYATSTADETGVTIHDDD